MMTLTAIILIMQGENPCPKKSARLTRGIGRDAVSAKLLSKPIRTLWTVDSENVQAMGKESC